MKIPRVHDFDPNAKVLELTSPLDGMPTIEKPKVPVPHTPLLQEQPAVITNEVKRSTPVRDVPLVLPDPPVPDVPLERYVRPVPLKKRLMKQRHPFDIYHDQYETLKRLADEERRQGEAGSMSAMVREALDTFIAAKNRKGKRQHS
jgi:hypothetical protein